jgi:hypothetical protein
VQSSYMPLPAEGQSGPAGSLHFLHTLTRADGKGGKAELVRARTTWIKDPQA